MGHGCSGGAARMKGSEMGDRVLMQCYSSKTGEVGPQVYGHYSGERAGDVVRQLRARMKGRASDLDYSSARLVQELVGMSDGNTGFGVSNNPKLLTEADSHGDAGVIIIDVDNNHAATCFGGYMKNEAAV